MFDRLKHSRTMVGVLLALTAGAAAPVRGQSAIEGRPEKATCTVKSLRGSYGSSFSGVTFPPLIPGDAVGVGRLSVAKDGAVEGTDVFSLNGMIIPRTLTGSLRVNPDCTGTAVLEDSTGFVIDLSFVVVDRGREIVFIQTNAGAAVTGVLKKQ